MLMMTIHIMICEDPTGPIQSLLQHSTKSRHQLTLGSLEGGSGRDKGEERDDLGVGVHGVCCCIILVEVSSFAATRGLQAPGSSRRSQATLYFNSSMT